MRAALRSLPEQKTVSGFVLRVFHFSFVFPLSHDNW
jgi:hypothetical protein